MEVQVAITMKESLGQNHARNRLSEKLSRCSILEVGEPGDFTGNGIRKKSWFWLVLVHTRYRANREEILRAEEPNASALFAGDPATTGTGQNAASCGTGGACDV